MKYGFTRGFRASDSEAKKMFNRKFLVVCKLPDRDIRLCVRCGVSCMNTPSRPPLFAAEEGIFRHGVEVPNVYAGSRIWRLEEDARDLLS
jgi:hypothetical protein